MIEQSSKLSNSKPPKNKKNVNSQSINSQQEVPIFQNDEIQMHQPWIARKFFVNVFMIMKKLYNYSKQWSLKQCPQISTSEETTVKLKEFQFKIAKLILSNQNKNQIIDIKDLTFRCILAVFLTFSKQILLFMAFILIQNITRLSIPFILSQLLNYNQELSGFYLTLLIILLIFGLLFRHNNFLYAQQITLNIRIVLINTLYNKISRLSSSSVKGVSIQKITTFMTTHLQNMQLKFQYLMLALTTPLILIYCLVMLIIWNGIQGIIGFTYFLSMFLINYIVNVKIKNSNMQEYKLKQKRRKILQQSIQGIRNVKINVWQNLFIKTIISIKQKQSQFLNYKFFLQTLQRSFSFSSSVISATIIYIATYFIQNTLSTPQIFATLQLFMFMRINIMYFSQLGIEHYTQLKQLFQNFLEFMQMEEKIMLNNNFQAPIIQEKKSKFQVILQKISLYWELGNPVIADINLKIQKGKKYCLTGNIGQGKSTFLKFLIKQIKYYQGNAQITNSVVYAEQQPFLIAATIKQNIIFGRSYQQQQYNNALYTSCLLHDLQGFQKNDQTIIQEDGINLSGGQKSRICLARALLKHKDLYLFDDIFSAIDIKVAHTILSRMFNSQMKNSSIILVTNNPNFLKYFDYSLKIQNRNEAQAISTLILCENKHIQDQFFAKQDNYQQIKQIKKKAVLQAGRQTDISTYYNYCSYANIFIWITTFLIFLLCQILFSLYSSNLKDLVNLESQDLNWIFTMFIAFALFFIYFAKYYFLIRSILKINSDIHNKVYATLLRSKLSFFQNHQKSQIVSKFGADINTLQTNFPAVACDAVEAPLYFLNLLVIICWNNPYFSILVPLLLFLIIFFYKKCTMMMRKTKLIDIKTRNSLANSFKLLINGNIQIKIYNRQEYFKKQLKNKIQDYCRTNLLYWSVQRGFGFLVQSIALVFSFIAIFLTYFINWNNQSNGQTLIYAIALSDYIQLGVRQISLLDSLMMSAQRLLKLQQNPRQQIQNIKQKSNLNNLNQSINIINDNSENRLQNWPSKGLVQFKNVSLTYSNGKKALKNINIQLQSSKKIGCLGRTGSGKTSLLNALFRFQQLSEGQILIDGINIKQISLQVLRNSFSVIAQHPFIFQGGIRKNLDPYNQHSNQQIIRILQSISLSKFIDKINDPTIHLTQSQKQLICLGRNLLKQHKSKILILDQATSSIDNITEVMIQKQIKKNYEGCTIFSIAHRVNTISHCDYLIEMKDGSAQKIKIFKNFRDLKKKELNKKQNNA